MTDLQPIDVSTIEDIGQEQSVADDGDTTEYYLLIWGAARDLPVETVEAKDAVEASEIFLDPGIAASVPYPPWEDGVPQAPLGPEIRLAIDEDGGKYVVGEVEWPGAELTHGVLWDSFTVDEIAEFIMEWDRMDREWDRRVGGRSR